MLLHIYEIVYILENHASNLQLPMKEAKQGPILNIEHQVQLISNVMRHPL
jgi:ribosomal protein S6